MVVHLIVKTSIKGKKRDGKVGYILALEKDGQINDLNTRREIYKVENTTQAAAELQAICKALERITMPVVLHIWTDNGYIFGSGSNHWVERWRENGWQRSGELIKNIDEWRAFLEITESRNIDVKWHLKEANPFNTYLEWEISKDE